MSGAIEASTALYLYTAQPSMTAISSREAQCQEEVLTREMLRRLRSLRDTALANDREQAASTATDYQLPSEEPKTEADRAVAQLFRFEQLDADWDGHEAAKPLGFSIKDARDFLRALAPESIIPRPTLHADGHAILFTRGADLYAELEFLEGRRIGFYARRSGQEWSGEFYFNGRTMPAGLSQIGFAT
jgi:hypothetical protein